MDETCRREGLYSSLITQWRHQRDEGALAGWSDRPPGRPTADRSTAELAKAKDEAAKLRDELATARELIEAHGKVSALLAELSRQSAEKNTAKP